MEWREEKEECLPHLLPASISDRIRIRKAIESHVSQRAAKRGIRHPYIHREGH